MGKRSVDAPGPYSAYLRRAASEPDSDLTRTDGGTPCGEYLRRFWQPVALSKEFEDTPRAVRVLGEDLVVFRDLSGRIGLLERHCSHRNTSLEFGRVRERGIQCCYHGWHYDIDGTILDIPTETPESTLKHRLRHGAYPVHEFKGLVFAYMGPPQARPAFPLYDFMDYPGEILVAMAWPVPCNWLQVRENTQDPLHINFLHSMFTAPQFGSWSAELPHIEYLETPRGQLSLAVRRVGDDVIVRTNDLILPNLANVPDVGDLQHLTEQGLGLTHWIVPHDDTHCMMIGWVHLHEDMDEAARQAYWEMMTFGLHGGRPYAERVREPGDWDSWASQGQISIHANEHLAASDAGVALYRRLLREQIDAVQAGRKPKGILWHAQPALATHARNVIRTIPKGVASAEEDVRLQLRVAREVVERLMADAALDARGAVTD